MAGTSASGAKRARIVPRGEEERWHWISFGNQMVETPVNFTTYLDDYDLPSAGQRQDGKMSMYECAKIQFYVEPWVSNGTAVPLYMYGRFTLQANSEETAWHVAGGKDLMNIHKLIARPDVYLVHAESHMQIETRVCGPIARPHVYDMTAPDGSGILFKGNRIWTSYCFDGAATLWADTLASYAFRCLVRIVWVDPAYYVQSAIGAANMGEH